MRKLDAMEWGEERSMLGRGHWRNKDRGAQGFVSTAAIGVLARTVTDTTQSPVKLHAFTSLLYLAPRSDNQYLSDIGPKGRRGCVCGWMGVGFNAILHENH